MPALIDTGQSSIGTILVCCLLLEQMCPWVAQVGSDAVEVQDLDMHTL